MTLQELIVKVSADIQNYATGMDTVLAKSRQVGPALEGAGVSASGFEAKLQAVGLTTESLSSKLSRVGGALTAAVTVPLVGVGAAALKVAGDLEQNEIAFTTMLKSSDAAQEHLDALRQFALTTPFQFDDLVVASKRMHAYGFAAKEVIPVLRNIGDAAAALGLGAEGINRIVIALGQMKAKGMVQAEEMRQLAEAGIPAWQILAKTLNTDVAGAMKAVEARTVEAAKAVPAILAGMNEQFGGLMEKQAKTLLGQWSNLKDQISFTLQDIGKVLAPVASQTMDGFIKPLLEGAKGLAAGFAALPPGMQQVVTGVGVLAAAIGPFNLVAGQAIGAVGNIGKLLTALPALLNPVTLGIAALGTAAAIGFMEFQKGTEQLHSLDAEFGKYITGMVQMEAAAGNGEFAQKKLNEALAAGAISAADYTKAMQLLESAQARAIGGAMTQQIRDMGLSFTIVMDGASKAAAGVADLTKKQGELDNEVIRTKAVLEEARRQYEAGTVSLGVLTAAKNNYTKALDAATGSQKSHILSAGELIAKQANLNAEVMRAQAVFTEMQARYDAGKASAVELALAHDQLNAAIKAATASGHDWLSVYNQIIREQREAAESAYASARAYLQMVQDFAAGSAQVNAAHAKMLSSFQNSGAAGIETWRRLVKEAGGYTVEVVTGGQRTEQVLGVTGQQARGLAEILSVIQGKAAAATNSMVDGIHKTIQYVDGGTRAVEVYTGSIGQATQAWHENADAVQGVASQVNGLTAAVDAYSASIGVSIDRMAAAALKTGAYKPGYYDGPSPADRVEAGLDRYGRKGGWGEVVGTFPLADPATGRAGWLPYNGGRGYQWYEPPPYSLEDEWERPKVPKPPPAPYLGPPPASTGLPAPQSPSAGGPQGGAGQEQLNDELLAMIARMAPFGEIAAFAKSIGAFVSKSVTDPNTLIVQLRDMNGVLDNFLRRIPYTFDDAGDALVTATQTVAGAAESVARQVGIAFADLGRSVEGSVESAAGAMREIVHPSLGGFDLPSLEMPSAPVPAAVGGGSWMRALTPAEIEALRRPDINISGNTFRSREDVDYLVGLIQERL